MNTIKISCPNGHRIQASSKLAGRTLPCPKCKQPVTVPAPSATAISDTGVMRILGEVTPLPPAPERIPDSKRACPRCHRANSASLSVCPHCKCYVGLAPNFLNSLTETSPRRAAN